MNPIEVWRPVFGMENVYEVSSCGRVRNQKHIVLAQSLVHGYRRVALTLESKRKDFKVHRLVLEAFVSPRPKGMMCRHLDGNKANNHLSNLAWGTNAENQADRVQHGTCNRGTRAPANILSESQVLEILSDMRPTRAIALDYSISATTVQKIKAGVSWAWFTGIVPKKGLCRGSTHRHAKLIEQQATAIRSDSRTYAEISAEYGISPSAVGRIKTGKTWAHTLPPTFLDAEAQ